MITKQYDDFSTSICSNSVVSQFTFYKYQQNIFPTNYYGKEAWKYYWWRTR